MERWVYTGRSWRLGEGWGTLAHLQAEGAGSQERKQQVIRRASAGGKVGATMPARPRR